MKKPWFLLFVLGVSLWGLWNQFEKAQGQAALASSMATGATTPSPQKPLKTAAAGKPSRSPGSAPSEKPSGPKGPANDGSGTQRHLASNPNEFSSLEELKNVYPNEWNLVTEKTSDGQDKILSLLMGPGENPKINKANARDFAEKLRPILGAPEAQLSDPESEYPEQYLDLQQRYQGREVFGNKLRIVLNTATSAPTTIKNQLSPIKIARDGVKFDLKEAENIVREKVIGAHQLLNLSSQREPQFYPRPPDSADLAWIIEAEWIEQKNLRRQQILISAVDGEILYQRDLIFH